MAQLPDKEDHWHSMWPEECSLSLSVMFQGIVCRILAIQNWKQESSQIDFLSEYLALTFIDQWAVERGLQSAFK